jgi:hypothetical protein
MCDRNRRVCVCVCGGGGVQGVLGCCKYSTDVSTFTQQAKYCLYELLSASRAHWVTIKDSKVRKFRLDVFGDWSVLFTLIWYINRYGNGRTTSHLRCHRLTIVASFLVHTCSVIKASNWFKKHKNSIPAVVCVFNCYTTNTSELKLAELQK